MRVPLDYYRILGLPIQATTEQLQQAHRDRALQLPRREYSEAAISARKQLLDEAYRVLSNPEQRQAYDASFLAKTYDLDPDRPPETPSVSSHLGRNDAIAEAHSPSIEIDDHHLVGALLILQELGEYELVLKLGHPYIRTTAGLKNGRLGDENIVRSDAVLTMALAYLELGREQWQQGQYENAASSLEHGQVLLLQEGVFPSVRSEIQADIYKLRPYRILELLALPPEQRQQRQQGLQLLQEMLQERGGIDGKGNDNSGLNTDDFIRFIHQLRDYLTTEEQQILFESEARRPSAVATYLAACALLARGFAQRQPRFIVQAKQFLARLGTRQDMHLEQAICALLLGQTEEVGRSLELSQDYGPLAFIREHSQNSPDLLPGLCLYAERWLQDEVFPHFADLTTQRASLKEYFADAHVQTYLEALPSQRSSSEEWTTTAAYSTNVGSAVRGGAGVATVARPHAGYEQPSYSQRQESLVAAGVPSAYADPVGRMAGNGSTNAGGLPSVPAAVRVSSVQAASRERGQAGTAVQMRPVDQAGVAQARRDRKRVDDGNTGSYRPLPPPIRHVKGAGTQFSKVRLFAVIVTAALILGGLGFLIYSLAAWVIANLTAPKLQGEQLSIQLEQPVLELPPPNATNATRSPTPETAAIVTPEVGQRIIEGWLLAKSEAFGQNYAVDRLDQVLAEPALSEWKNRAETARIGSWYAQYKHSVRILSATMNQVDAKLATVEAEVGEMAEFYQNGQPDRSRSYNEVLQVRYFLVRQGDQWRIQDIEVISTVPGATVPGVTSNNPSAAPMASPTPETGTPPSPTAPAATTGGTTPETTNSSPLPSSAPSAASPAPTVSP